MLRQVTRNPDYPEPTYWWPTAEGGLIHIELQSSDVSNMAIRMAELALASLSNFQQLTKRIVLYAGQEELSMEAGFNGLLSLRYALFDFRDLESAPLPASVDLEYNLLVI